MVSLQEKINQFDPNAPAISDGLFGLPFTTEEANIIILPTPWEVTVSYSAGTAKAPQAILQASQQVDLLDSHVPNAWKAGIAIAEIDQQWEATSNNLRRKITPYFDSLDEEKFGKEITEVNKTSEAFTNWVKEQSTNYLNQGKIVSILGGDHSTPLGLMQVLADKNESFGILQVDAHMDLRKSYEGFTHSHASIMYNAIQLPQVSRLVQVGIRDYCEEEVAIAENDKRITTVYNHLIQERLFNGIYWHQICDSIISQLPQKVYISFDIDGLEPTYCPNTGTPVPGGLTFDQAVYLISHLVKSGRTIIGFDLCEVAPGDTEWDANVGARMLYKLANLTALSNKIIP